jgi:hypothetical protein
MAKQNCWEFKKCGREQGGYMSAQWCLSFGDDKAARHA